jgi:hypothetical protein
MTRVFQSYGASVDRQKEEAFARVTLRGKRVEERRKERQKAFGEKSDKLKERNGIRFDKFRLAQGDLDGKRRERDSALRDRHQQQGEQVGMTKQVVRSVIEVKREQERIRRQDWRDNWDREQTKKRRFQEEVVSKEIEKK